MAVSHVSLELTRNKSGRRINHLGMEDDNSKAETPQPETLETFYMEDQRLMAANLTLPESMRLPDAIFNCISCESRREFIRNRRQCLEQLSKQSLHDSTDTTKPSANKPQPSPTQYNRANLAELEEASDSESTFEEQEFVGMVAAFIDANSRLQNGLVLSPNIQQGNHEEHNNIEIGIEDRHAYV